MQKTASRIAGTILLQTDMASGPRFELRRVLRRREKELERYMLNDVVLEDKAPRYF